VGLEAVVIRFHGENAAVLRYSDARDGLGRLVPQEELPQWTRDVGFVERHHSGHMLIRGTFAGHYLDVDEGDRVSEQGGREGAAAGGLIGVLGGPPGIAVGLLIGAITGAELGHPREIEPEPAALAEQLREAVPESSSAIVMIAPAAEVDALLSALGSGAGDVARRALSDEEVAALERSLEAAPPAASAD
jgi:uncharacterized membrane protein